MQRQSTAPAKVSPQGHTYALCTRKARPRRKNRPPPKRAPESGTSATDKRPVSNIAHSMSQMNKLKQHPVDLQSSTVRLLFPSCLTPEFGECQRKPVLSGCIKRSGCESLRYRVGKAPRNRGKKTTRPTSGLAIIVWREDIGIDQGEHGHPLLPRVGFKGFVTHPCHALPCPT